MNPAALKRTHSRSVGAAVKAHGYMDTAGSEQLVCNFENWAAVRKQTLLSAQSVKRESRCLWEEVSLGRVGR